MTDISFKDQPEFPEGYDKDNPPPSGFEDEPEVYEEAHVEGQDTTSAVVVVDPIKDEVVGIMDLSLKDSRTYSGAPVIIGRDEEPLGES